MTRYQHGWLSVERVRLKNSNLPSAFSAGFESHQPGIFYLYFSFLFYLSNILYFSFFSLFFFFFFFSFLFNDFYVKFIVTIVNDITLHINIDQLAKLTFRSRYAHAPFGSAPVPILSS